MCTATCECLNVAVVDSCTQRAHFRGEDDAVGCRLCDGLSVYMFACAYV